MDQIQTTMPAKLAAAFVKAQSEFATVMKNATNPEFEKRYANLDAVIVAIHEGLRNNKIGVIQRGVPVPGHAAIETIFVHESGEMFSCGIMQAPLAINSPQGFGSAVTYLRRYSLKAACNIGDGDDDGMAASLKSVDVVTQTGAASVSSSASSTTSTPIPGAAHPENIKAIKTALDAAGSNEVKMLHWLKSQATTLAGISPAEALRASKSLGISLPIDESNAPAAAEQPVKAEQSQAEPAQPAPAGKVANANEF